MSEKKVKCIEIIMNDNESLQIIENRFLATIDKLHKKWLNLINKLKTSKNTM